MKPKNKNRLLNAIGYILGLLFAWLVWSMSAHASNNTVLQDFLPSPLMWLSAIIGALGSYLVFGEDKKWPPSAQSFGHILLGFGAGVFFTKGSLELMGMQNSSHDLVLFVAFLWAVAGYFVLRLFIAVLNSDLLSQTIIQIVPTWFAKLLGVKGKHHDDVR